MANSYVFLFVVIIFAISVGALFIVVWHFQKLIAEKSIDEVKLKNAEIEKAVDAKSLDELVDDNNKGAS